MGVCLAVGMLSVLVCLVYRSVGVSDHLQGQQDLKGGRGSASLVAKCKMCSRENSLGESLVAISSALKTTSLLIL